MTTTSTTYEVVRRTAKSVGGKGTVVATHASAIAAVKDAAARDESRNWSDDYHQVRAAS